MQPPYTFKNLELITGGNPALDIDLLETFLTTSRDYIAAMHAAHRTNDHEDWQGQAHALKGSCFNIGADYLGEICETTQFQGEIAGALRSEILQKIENEFANLEQAIFQIIKEKNAGAISDRMIRMVNPSYGFETPCFPKKRASYRRKSVSSASDSEHIKQQWCNRHVCRFYAAQTRGAGFRLSSV